MPASAYIPLQLPTRLCAYLQHGMRLIQFPLQRAPLALVLAASWGVISVVSPGGKAWQIVVLALAVFWPALAALILWAECRSWIGRARDMKKYKALLVERVQIEWQAATIGETIAKLCVAEEQVNGAPAEELYRAMDALSQVDRRHAIYADLAAAYCRTRYNLSNKKHRLDQHYALQLTDPPPDAYAYGRPSEPLQAIFYFLLKYDGPKWTLQFDPQYLMRVLLDRQQAASASSFSAHAAAGCFFEEALPRLHQEWEMLLSPAFKKSFRGLPQSSQQVILRTMLDVAAKAADRPVRLVGSQKCSRRAVAGHELVYLSAAGCRKILFVDVVAHPWAVLPTVERDIRAVPRPRTPTRESAIAEWGYRARRGRHAAVVLRIDTFGTQTPPPKQPRSDTKSHGDPRDRAVTVEDYEELRPLPTDRGD
jgi:hypothetical protein